MAIAIVSALLVALIATALRLGQLAPAARPGVVLVVAMAAVKLGLLAWLAAS